MDIVKVSELSKSFGGVKAVRDISLSVKAGEISGVIGPNGAGKTTFFNLLTGNYAPTSGLITYNLDKTYQGRQIRPRRMTRYGVARTFQNIRLFKEMTVFENILMGYHCNISCGVVPSVLRLPSFFSGEKEAGEKVNELLEIFRLTDRRGEKARNLSYGDQRKVEIARALASGPRILLLDEPAAGMNPNETRELTRLIRWVKDQFDLTVILIEHDMSLVMKLCDSVHVFDYGHLIAAGTPAEIQQDEKVIRAYLGGDFIAHA